MIKRRWKVFKIQGGRIGSRSGLIWPNLLPFAFCPSPFNKAIRRLTFLFFLLIVSCAPPPHRAKRIPKPPKRIIYPTPRETFLYQEGKSAFEVGKTTLAMEKLEQFIRKNPESELTDDAMFLMGQIFLKRENPYEALRYFQKIEQNFPGSNTIEEAVYGQSYCLYRLKEFERSKEVLDRLFSSFPLLAPLYIRAKTLEGHLCILKKKVLCGIRAYLSARSKATNPTEKSVLDAFIEKAIFGIDERPVLRDIIREHPGDIAGGVARVRLAEVLILQKKYKEAKEILTSSLVNRLPDVLRQKVKALLTKIKRAFIKKISIGCLLPLTGKRAPFGVRALKGVLLAAEAFQANPKNINITLMVRDTKGKPERAGEMAGELINTCHVRAIVGPMFLDTTKAALQQIQESPVPLISLSQAEGVPELGRDVFRNCLTPAQQIRTLVNYLTVTLHIQTAAILYPRTPFGLRYMKLFWDRFTEAGGEVRGAESYLPSDTDFGTPIKKLIGLYYTKERWERGNTPLDDEGKFAPVIDFETLFIPDIYSKVILIAPQLAFYDVSGVTLTGINTWNAPELIREGKKYVRGAIFTDGFFPRGSSPTVRLFVRDFKAIYNETPEILAAQAYDAAKLLVRLFKQYSIDDTDRLEELLREDTGYHGVSGLRYFDASGEAVREVLVLTVTRRGIVPVFTSPSPIPSSP